MKYVLSFLLFCLTFSLAANSQPKTVYISIDVSISMRGDKYNLANYTVQMITQLMNSDDELYLGMGGKYRKLSIEASKRKGTLASIQRTLQSLNIDWRDSEESDIDAFNKVFRNQEGRDQWYFIIGDGYWDLLDVCSDFKKVISKYPIKVYFLETMKNLGEHGDFGKCLDELSFVTQYRSSNDPQTIIDNCTKVATSLFGISDESASAKKVKTNTYSFTSLLPVNKIYITYQDKTNTTGLATLKSANSNGVDIPITRQSTISTEKIRTKTESLLSGQVIVLTPAKAIMPNQAIELIFDKDIDLSKLNIYPMVDVQPGIINVAVATGMATTTGDDSFICQDNTKATITYELADEDGKPLPEAILKKTVVKIKSNKGEVTATLVNGVFQYEIPLGTASELVYTIEAECAGYFKQISNKRKIVKNDNCFQTAVSIDVKHGLAETKGETTVVCLQNDKATITYELSDAKGKSLPLSTLERTVVKVKSKSGEGIAELVNGVFQYEITLGQNTETVYTIEAECAGEFKIATSQKRIVRDGNCAQTTKNDPIIMGSIRSGDIKNDACVKAIIVSVDNHDEIFNPKDYNLKIKRDYKHLFKDVEITNVTDTDFEFCFRSYGIWCECFLPDTITLTVYGVSKVNPNEIIEQPFKFHIDKSDTSWFVRCKWVIGVMLGLLILILYLNALNKKKRFKKGSVVRYQYFGVGGIKSRQNIDDLRKKGFFAWFARWFIPFSGEKSSKLFAKAGNKLFSFSATTSNQRVEIPKAQYNPKAMSSIDFDRDQFERKAQKVFTMTDNTFIKITLPNGTGSFQFCYDKSIGIKDDISSFRAFCSTLIFIAVIIELFLGYFLITALF